MNPTKLIYLEDFTALESDAAVLEVLNENDKSVVILDQTVLYAQGGGQPYDQGWMENEHGKFRVEEVRFVEGIVKHIGYFESGSFEAGQTVHCKVDQERRELNSRLHSAGHAVDWALLQLGIEWVPGKGYHFPDGPYVEYAGSAEGMDKEKLKADLEAKCAEFIGSGRTTRFIFIDKDKMHEYCHHVPDKLPEGKPTRVLLLGDFGVPCGGTHVSKIEEIRSISIRKIKGEKETIRVAYDVER